MIATQLDFNETISANPFPIEKTEIEMLNIIQNERSAAQAETVPSFRPIHHLSDTELFAKLLAIPIVEAEKFLNENANDLKYLAGQSETALQNLIGSEEGERLAAAFELGKRLAKAHAEREQITSPSDVADLMMSKMRYLQKEIVCVLCLDTKGGVTVQGVQGDAETCDQLQWGTLIAESTIFEGTLNASVFHPREIFRFAIEYAANAIVLVHNHPSGCPQPSQEDIRATKQLIEAGNQIGIKMMDHIVIGDGIFVSLKEEGYI